MRALALVAGAGLVVGGLVAILSRRDDHRTASSSSATPTATVTTQLSANAEDAGTQTESSPLPTLERRILALVATAPSRKLPRQLVDPRTNAMRTDVRATCRRDGARTFACVVASPQQPPGEGLYVRYRLGRGGGGTFAWLGYRRG